MNFIVKNIIDKSNQLNQLADLSNDLLKEIESLSRQWVSIIETPKGNPQQKIGFLKKIFQKKSTEQETAKITQEQLNILKKTFTPNLFSSLPLKIDFHIKSSQKAMLEAMELTKIDTKTLQKPTEIDNINYRPSSEFVNKTHSNIYGYREQQNQMIDNENDIQVAIATLNNSITAIKQNIATLENFKNQFSGYQSYLFILEQNLLAQQIAQQIVQLNQ